MRREEFAPTRMFIDVLKAGDFHAARAHYDKELRPRADEHGRALFETLLVDALGAVAPPSAAAIELTRICDEGGDGDGDERGEKAASNGAFERRKRMFELYNTKRMRRPPTYEEI